jgi:SAM-dependent methyltransferase
LRGTRRRFAPERVPVTDSSADARERMRLLYDAYYDSRDYEQRYPRPNLGTLDFLLRHGAAQARQLADVGCGNGRYAVPLLERGTRQVIACDISSSALEGLAARVQATGLAARVRVVLGGAESLPSPLALDCIVMMFGVLSHVATRPARIEVLRQLRRRAAADARLLLSVPSRWRRRPVELLVSWLAGRQGFGDIEFTRTISGRPETFFYHLYTLRGLREDLARAGWRMETAEAESVFPEWAVTQWPVLAAVDHRLQRWLPAALGYGIRVAACPETDWSDDK